VIRVLISKVPQCRLPIGYYGSLHGFQKMLCDSANAALAANSAWINCVTLVLWYSVHSKRMESLVWGGEE